jgi:peptidoglycan/xylan/chitin deacetylase (PgdA/CDA1 family)
VPLALYSRINRIDSAVANSSWGAELIARKVLPVFAALLAQVVTQALAGVQRPPQFVIMAFDNCTEIERWQELTDFTAEMNADRNQLHFTFFVSGVNFIADAVRNLYEGPRHRRGYSSIGFGGSSADVRRRVDFANDLRRKGHEIASHAVGHFDGGDWSAAEWDQEFRSFQNAVENVGINNGFPDGIKIDLPAAQMRGFRAPYLASDAALYPVLKAKGFRYDTSGENFPDAWPEKPDGIWRFNLALLRMHGSGKRLLSMDYNFFVEQSNGIEDAGRSRVFGDQMLETYLDYFNSNYEGNRAPLHIGHHFTNFQGGAYDVAVKTFARRVCGLPEVRCTTYSELADFLDEQTPEALAAYGRGDFDRLNAPKTSLARLAPYW